MNPKIKGFDDVDWINLAQNTDQYQKLLRALGQFLTTSAKVTFLTRTPVDGEILLAETTADWTGTKRIFNPGEQSQIWRSNSATPNPLLLKINIATLFLSFSPTKTSCTQPPTNSRPTALLPASRPTTNPL
jgi:hypothetical protein